MISIVWSGAIILASALSSLAFPFTTYTATLATFGIAHVAIELRYIDSRFHQTLDGTIELRLLQLVLLVAFVRSCGIFGLISAELARLLELGCGLGLVLLATHPLYRQNWRLGALGVAVGCLLGIGIIRDPIATSVTFAIIHNLTPIGFILERQRSTSIRTLLTCLFVFGLLPLLIVLCQSLSLANLPLETNVGHLNAFVAPSWQQSAIAYPLFSGVTFLQCMHYAVVIGLFSQWTSERSKTLLPWFPSKYFYGLLGGVSVCFLIAFYHSFVVTRALYGVVAAIHAWLEIPLLLLLPLQSINQKTAAIGSKISTEG